MFSGRRMEESAPTLNLADVRRTIEPLYEGQKLFTGESVMAHAEGVVISFAAFAMTMTFWQQPIFFVFGTNSKIRKNG